MSEKVVLAYSGGLDTTALIPWLKENFNYLYNTIVKAKPSTVKGTYIENISVSTTMGPGIKVDKNSFDK